MKLSVCGLVCNKCPYHLKPCGGCREVNGRPFWVDDLEEESCVLFQCSLEKGYHSCADCLELPCQSFRELKDPDISDEEHLLELDRRVERLRRQK